MALSPTTLEETRTAQAGARAETGNATQEPAGAAFAVVLAGAQFAAPSHGPAQASAEAAARSPEPVRQQAASRAAKPPQAEQAPVTSAEATSNKTTSNEAASNEAASNAKPRPAAAASNAEAGAAGEPGRGAAAEGAQGDQRTRGSEAFREGRATRRGPGVPQPETSATRTTAPEHARQAGGAEDGKASPGSGAKSDAKPAGEGDGASKEAALKDASPEGAARQAARGKKGPVWSGSLLRRSASKGDDTSQTKPSVRPDGAADGASAEGASKAKRVARTPAASQASPPQGRSASPQAAERPASPDSSSGEALPEPRTSSAKQSEARRTASSGQAAGAASRQEHAQTLRRPLGHGGAGAGGQGSGAGERSALAPPPQDASLGDGAFTLEAGEEAAASALPTGAGPARSSGPGARTSTAAAASRRALPGAAWARAAAQGPSRTAALAGGWKAMELALGDGNGNVTVQARRDADGVAVSVGFSEPRLQAQATANARQLQDALQARYESEVDLSFDSGAPDGGEPGSTPDDPPGHGSASRPSTDVPANATTAADPDRAQDAAQAGAQRVWVG